MTRGSPCEHRSIRSGAGVSPRRCVAVIPARWGSSRVPGKPLVELGGVPLVERVRARVAAATWVDEVVVATDDVRIAAVVRRGGGRALLTGPAPSGTHRVAAVLEALEAAWVVNVQCDQPALDPDHVDAVIGLLHHGAEVATVAAPLPASVDPSDPSVVKVVADAMGRALYFSRAPVPHGGPFWRHVGVYGFTREALVRCAAAPDSPLRRAEDLEQLAWLDAGIPIRVARVAHAESALDTPSHLRSWTAHPPRIP